MSQPPTYSGFEWKIKFAKPQQDQGQILEVEIEYPTHLPIVHNGFPLTSEELIVKKMAFRISNRTNRKQQQDKHRESYPEPDGQEKICSALKILLLYL